MNKSGVAFHTGCAVFHPERTFINLFSPAEGKISDNLKNLVKNINQFYILYNFLFIFYYLKLLFLKRLK